MAKAQVHDVSRAVLRGGEYGDITLYNENNDILVVVTSEASLGLEDIELEQE